MTTSRSNTEQAFCSVNQQRNTDPTDPALAQAEHYLFARDYTSSTDGLASISLIPAVPLYSAA